MSHISPFTHSKSFYNTYFLSDILAEIETSPCVTFTFLHSKYVVTPCLSKCPITKRLFWPREQTGSVLNIARMPAEHGRPTEIKCTLTLSKNITTPSCIFGLNTCHMHWQMKNSRRASRLNWCCDFIQCLLPTGHTQFRTEHTAEHKWSTPTQRQHTTEY